MQKTDKEISRLLCSAIAEAQNGAGEVGPQGVKLSLPSLAQGPSRPGPLARAAGALLLRELASSQKWDMYHELVHRGWGACLDPALYWQAMLREPFPLKAIRRAIAAGEPVDVCDFNGQTPLHMAALSLKRNPKVISALIEAGANPRARNNANRTPICHAMSHWRWADVAHAFGAGPKDALAMTKAGWAEIPMPPLERAMRAAPMLPGSLAGHDARLEEMIGQLALAPGGIPPKIERSCLMSALVAGLPGCYEALAVLGQARGVGLSAQTVAPLFGQLSENTPEQSVGRLECMRVSHRLGVDFSQTVAPVFQSAIRGGKRARPTQALLGLGVLSIVEQGTHPCEQALRGLVGRAMLLMEWGARLDLGAASSQGAASKALPRGGAASAALQQLEAFQEALDLRSEIGGGQSILGHREPKAAFRL